jgi:POT family proton-dependent oligopeptide transporter
MYTVPNFLKILFFVEIFERVGYYGIRTLLVLFLISKFQYTDTRAYEIFSVATAILFMSPMLGSFLADRIFGFKRVLTLGGMLILIGQLIILYSILKPHYFFLGLSMFVIGTGFFKSNLMNLLGVCYAKNDPNRTHGFILLHVGVNIGSALSAIVCGYVAHFYGWYYAFSISAVCSFIGIGTYLKYQDVFAKHGNSPQPKMVAKRYFGVSLFQLVLLILLFISFGCYKVISLNLFNEREFKYFGLFVLYLFVYFFVKSHNKKNFLAITTLLLCSVMFFVVGTQFSSAIPLFSQRNVVKEIFGYSVPSLVWQAINPLCVIIFGSIIAMHKNRKKTNDLLKFILGLCATMFALVLLYIGCLNANANSQVSSFYLFFSILIIGAGEIFVFPFIGSRMTALSPVNLQGFVMALQMFFMAFSNITLIYSSRFLSIPSNNGVYDSAVSLAIYSSGFLKIALYNLALLCVLIPLLLLLKKVINSE